MRTAHLPPSSSLHPPDIGPALPDMRHGTPWPHPPQVLTCGGVATEACTVGCPWSEVQCIMGNGHMGTPPCGQTDWETHGWKDCLLTPSLTGGNNLNVDYRIQSKGRIQQFNFGTEGWREVQKDILWCLAIFSISARRSQTISLSANCL